jgi:hypothetical protein
MTHNAWPLVELAARPLSQDERDAVLGDSLEAGDSPWQALCGVLGFVVRRQGLLWKSWRPWLAVFGVALPSSFLLTGVSLSVTCTYERLMGFNMGHWASPGSAGVPTGHEGVLLLLCHIFLLISWSWTSGFALGSLSPRTLWWNAAPCSLLAVDSIVCSPPMGALLKLSLFLFLLPAILGVRHGVRAVRLNLGPAFLLAVTITVLMISAWTNSALWIFNWLLICPAWFLVATAHKPGSDWDRSNTSRIRRPVRT